jgi:transposase
LPFRKRRFHHPFGSGSMTVAPFRASCSCCGPGSPGSICRSSLATARYDLLAAPEGMATGRCVPGTARALARAATRRRTPRPLHGGLRLRVAAGAFGGEKTGPSPVDRRKLGSKHHLITDANGTPLACLLTGANANDVTQLLPLVAAIPAIRGMVGRPRRRPTALLADRGYDSTAHRQALRTLGIRPVIARRKTAHGSGLGSQRWVVERTLSWLRQHRRLRIRYERTAEIHEAFLSLACSLICLRTLRGPFC